VPTPSKFRAAARTRIIEILVAGGSRAAAARAAGVDPATLHRWVEKGRNGDPEGRWRMFSDLVELAESRQQPPVLVGLSAQEQQWAAHPDLAWKFLEQHEPGFAMRPGPEQIQIEVAYSAPVKEGDPA
jgi:transposase-like protein